MSSSEPVLARGEIKQRKAYGYVRIEETKGLGRYQPMYKVQLLHLIVVVVSIKELVHVIGGMRCSLHYRCTHACMYV